MSASPFHGRPFVFRVNDNGGGPHLLLQVCVERGWREYNSEAGGGAPRDTWNLWWRTSGFPLSHYKQLKAWQFTNHIPKGSMICRKDNLARYLRCMRKVYGPIYDFSPLGYNLPLEYTKLVAECTRQRRNHESSVWICKPVSQSQGRGIFLFRKVSELTYDSNAVVQQYIENPLLIGGYKFDLRLYVCIPSYHPLTVYLYREGLARFGTDKFSLSDLDNPFRHLTNSSLNKLGRGYTQKKDRVGAGCKWSLRQLRHYLHQAGHSDWLLWQKVAALVVLTVLSHSPSVPTTANCFEFYGFDVLVDSSLRPWLLEVNLSPALGNDCDVDAAVKKPMLHDMFDLLGLPVCNTGLSLFAVFSVAPAEAGGGGGGASGCGCSGSSGDESEEAGAASLEADAGGRRGPGSAIAVVTAASRWKRRHLLVRESSAGVGGPRARKKSAGASPSPGALVAGAGAVAGRKAHTGRACTPPPRAASGHALLVGGPDCSSEFGPGSEASDDPWACCCYTQGLRSGGRCYSGRAADRAASAASAAASAPTAMWGNGRDWRRPPASEGAWVRLCPLDDRAAASAASSAASAPARAPSPGPPSVGDREVRDVVAAVTRYVKAARDIYRRSPQLSDADYSAAMRDALAISAEVWVPPC
ncbi:probable tubulin polyglutamylase TTLL2 [Schistocerca gregaria]|uniref:probable tubulin polyglutamylase TTLL2 n=1 Tax=Schistocerca gregaria TaxID=7010 RepID=UPI00211DEB0B|nr:probable tubulin polyglutamylase TTLL2 [Schistocerca gregaria]